MKTNKSMQNLWDDSYLSGADSYLDTLYDIYLHDSAQLDPYWKNYFDQLGGNTATEISPAEIRNYFIRAAKQPKRHIGPAIDSAHEQKQEKVIDLITAYRTLGHLEANIDPLGLYKGIHNATLDLFYYGFTEADLNTVYNVGTYGALHKANAPLKEIYDSLRKVYCSTIGLEYMHITHLQEVAWFQERIEQGWAYFSPSKEQKLRLLNHLVISDGLEKYLGSKYVGQKRFSVEGGDSLVPLLDAAIARSVKNGIKEIIIGMAHRGRLNVLVNVLGKRSKTIFEAFEGTGVVESHSGDVKYHLGYSSDVETEHGPIHLTLAFNPSHLEIVSPVVQGSVRSRQRRRRDTEQKLAMPIQIHGDAAFAGQGVVMETFQMSQVRWFCVGGSLHIVVNNQIGFTISDRKDSRSSIYCTDVAKMIEAPILHVNSNDPEAVLFAAQLAADYRDKFKKDVVIDLVCYRRHGHNEADEPSATQPLMYKVIKSMPPAATLYARKLIKEGLIEEDTEAKILEHYRKELDEGKSVVDLVKDKHFYEYANLWEPFLGEKNWDMKIITGVPHKKLVEIATKLTELPEGFVLQPQVKKMMEAREKMTEGKMPLNWGYAETLAYATLLLEGYPIRICGQDSARGTFAHRHAVLHDQNSDQIYIPLSHLAKDQVQINLVDSLLSEEAVLAFEYGYASAEPNNLVIWEAQFGDFANGAQVVIDQFISSGEQKWGRLCGLVMFLPHGYEGMGPEHSSARLERYLQLCAQQNMQVCSPTTPAQIFHLIRRQMVRPYRKPLVIMTPKSLLRHPLAVSKLEDLETGEFQVIIPEIDDIDPNKVERLVMCTGKIYFELLEKRRELGIKNIAIVRIEQLYPFPDTYLPQYFTQYKNMQEFVWCQEEPENQGAWYAIKHHFTQCLQPNQKMIYAGRPASASPASGYLSIHLQEQEDLVNAALNQPRNQNKPAKNLKNSKDKKGS